MGIKTFFHELKTKVSPSRLFKAVITDGHNTLPKACPGSVKSVEVAGGGPVAPGCILHTTFEDGKTAKNKVEHIDPVNFVCKNTLIEGSMLGDKVEKIGYEINFDASEDEGCVVKIKSEFHTKEGHELSDDDVANYKEQILGLYRTCEEYLIANPHACN